VKLSILDERTKGDLEEQKQDCISGCFHDFGRMWIDRSVFLEDVLNIQL
jgi:hypothetical protein